MKIDDRRLLVMLTKGFVMNWLCHKTAEFVQGGMGFSVVSKTMSLWLHNENDNEHWFEFIIEQEASWTEQDGSIHTHQGRCGLRTKLGFEFDGCVAGNLDMGKNDRTPVLEEGH